MVLSSMIERLKTRYIYFMGQQIGMFIKAFQELFLRAIFQPEELAIFNLIQVIASTFTTVSTDVVGASTKLISQLYGRNAKLKLITAYRGNALIFEVSQQFFLSLIMILVAPKFGC